MAKLVSVNVGLPAEIAWEGRIVRTAIWKRPVTGRIQARRLNLEGDGQGDLEGHGGEHRAVMVYQLEAYRYWERELNRHDFEHGQFGENFTVEGLADSEVCIGDRYSIGGAVFEVTQPRVTCYRLGMRMANPQMPALVVAHRRPGFYFRVITEGDVGAGDEIEKIAEGPEQIPVAEIDGLLYTPNHDLKRIARAVRIPALSLGWKHSFESFLEADRNGVRDGNPGLASASASPPAWEGFRAASVASVHKETAEITSIVFADPRGTPLPPALPGQYLVVRIPPGREVVQPIVRSYSISGPAHAGVYRISVKRGNGPGSRHLVDAVEPGDSLEISAPRGEFILQTGTRPVVLLSAGIGATPVLAMLHALARNADASRKVWWIHAARNAAELAFAQEVRELLASIPDSRSAIAFSHPEQPLHPGAGFDREGHWERESLRQLGLPLDADFYLCGPTGFLADMHRDLLALGVPREAIHQEIFGSEGSIQPGIAHAIAKPPHVLNPPAAGPRVSFTRSGLEVPWDDRFRSILEFAEACDVPVRWSCRTGVCHTCESGLLDGQVQYAPKPLDLPAAGRTLICCSTPLTQISLDL